MDRLTHSTLARVRFRSASEAGEVIVESLREDELDDASSSRQAERDAERRAVPRDIGQDEDQGNESDRAKTRHRHETYSRGAGLAGPCCGGKLGRLVVAAGFPPALGDASRRGGPAGESAVSASLQGRIS